MSTPILPSEDSSDDLPASTHSSFSKFPLLPPEIRSQIWHHTNNAQSGTGIIKNWYILQQVSKEAKLVSDGVLEGFSVNQLHTRLNDGHPLQTPNLSIRKHSRLYDLRSESSRAVASHKCERLILSDDFLKNMYHDDTHSHHPYGIFGRVEFWSDEQDMEESNRRKDEHEIALITDMMKTKFETLFYRLQDYDSSAGVWGLDESWDRMSRQSGYPLEYPRLEVEVAYKRASFMIFGQPKDIDLLNSHPSILVHSMLRMDTDNVSWSFRELQLRINQAGEDVHDIWKAKEIEPYISALILDTAARRSFETITFPNRRTYNRQGEFIQDSPALL